MNTAKDAKEERREERGTSERPKESTGKLKRRGANLYGTAVDNFRTNFHTNVRTYFGAKGEATDHERAAGSIGGSGVARRR